MRLDVTIAITALLACAPHASPVPTRGQRIAAPTGTELHKRDSPAPQFGAAAIGDSASAGSDARATTHARSRETEPADARLQTALVRAALAEARWSEADHIAIFHVLQRWSRRMGWTLEVAIKVRIAPFSRRPPKWIARLQPSCEEPSGWPQRFSWGAHYDLCVELFARAESFLRGGLPDVCPGAEGWRRPGKALDEALANGRVRVWCASKTANGFVRSRG